MLSFSSQCMQFRSQMMATLKLLQAIYYNTNVQKLNSLNLLLRATITTPVKPQI
jgi:hypothetical protein